MRFETVKNRMQQMINNGIIDTNSSVLCICADMQEKALFQSLDFKNVTISNLNKYNGTNKYKPFKFERQDAMNIQNEKKCFDFVSDGLHHCSSPHKALTEIYRVCKKGIIVFESRDSILMKLAVQFKLTEEYEIAAVLANGSNSGGVDNTQIPNYIYRWTEREFEKTINSCYPIGRNKFMFFYDLNMPKRMRKFKIGKIVLEL